MEYSCKVVDAANAADIMKVDADVSRVARRLSESEWPLTGPGDFHA